MEFEDIATVLIEQGLLLTALELHVELEERGKGLKSLNKFFSDASNFDKFTRKLDGVVPASPSPSARSSVQVTLDEFSRHSEDSHATDDRLAVLEFELRRANNTIHSLRNELTSHAATSKIFTRSSDASGQELVPGPEDAVLSTNNHAHDEVFEEEDSELEIKSHEQRVLNYLVNEYLLQRGYKLTSITFSDENCDEDFEDWDSVGLNISKPPNLLRLFRNFNHHVRPPRPSCDDASVQTVVDQEVTRIQVELAKSLATIDNLKQEIDRLERAFDNKETELITTNCLLDEMRYQVEHHQSQLSCLIKEEKSSKSGSPAPNEESFNPEPILESSTSFYKSIMSQISFLSDSARSLAWQKRQAPLEDGEALLHVMTELADAVPKVLPNVLLAKRDELIPLLLVTITYHSDAKVRDQFLNLLFNLIKRPDESQRHLILDGFEAMIVNLGPTRIEAELLPQCWEQLNHKYEERRMLVASTCGRLIPFIPLCLRSSLIFSILNQLALEDKDVGVRILAIQSLAILVFHLDSDEKYQNLWETTNLLLKSKHDQVSQSARTSLLPAMLQWSLKLNWLERPIINDIMNDLKIKIQSHNMFESRIEDLKVSIPFLIWSLISSQPGLETPTELEQDSKYAWKDPVSLAMVEVVAGMDIKQVIQDFQTKLSNSWPQLEFVSESFLKDLFDLCACIDFTDEASIHSSYATDLVKILQLTTDILGAEFASKVLEPMFEIRSFQDGSQNKDSLLKAAFAISILQVVKTPTEFIEVIKTWALAHLTAGKSCHFILFIAKLCPDLNENLAEMAWTFVVHSSTKVRTFGSVLLAYLALQSDDETTMASRILPGLVTLSSDPEPGIRIPAIQGIANVIRTAKDPPSREKACVQFLSFFEDEQSHQIYLKVVHCVHMIWTDLPTKFREDVILVNVVNLFDKYGDDETRCLITSESDRTDMATALLTLFETISEKPLSGAAYHNALSASLRRLGFELEHLVPALKPRVVELISKLDGAYGSGLAGAALSTSASSQGLSGTPSKVPQSASLDDMKQRVGKFLKTPSGSVSFWKK